MILRRALVLCAVFVLTGSSFVFADFKESYRRGMQARNRSNWAEAVRWFREALKERPAESGESINIAGAEFEPYLPNFQLGFALYRTHDCAGAAEAWQVAESAPALAKSRYARAFKEAKFDCDGRNARTQPAAGAPAAPVVDADELKRGLARAEDALQAAGDADAAVRRLAEEPSLKQDWLGQTGVVAAQTRAQAFLAEARQTFEDGRQNSDPKTLGMAATLAASARQQFDLLREAAEQRRAQLIARAAEQAKLDAPPQPQPASAPVAAAAPSAAMPDLLPLIDAFMEGRYREVASMAEQHEQTPGTPGAHAALFGAAANYQLFVRGGERDRLLRDRAATFVRRARALAPELQPDARVFSPRFATFFSAQR